MNKEACIMNNQGFKGVFKLNLSISRLILTFMMLLIVVVGGTFAWFTFSSRQSALVLTIGNINNTHITLTPYQVKEDTYFVLGDERELSIDSRNTTIGTISKEQILGKVIFRVWPLNNISLIK